MNRLYKKKYNIIIKNLVYNNFNFNGKSNWFLWTDPDNHVFGGVMCKICGNFDSFLTSIMNDRFSNNIICYCDMPPLIENFID